MQIRPATLSDLNSILSILNYEIENSTAVYEEQTKSLDDISVWFKQKQIDQFPLIVAELDNEVLAYGTYDKFRQRMGYRFTVEHSVYVAKQHRGKGIGKELLIELIRLAKTKKYHSMIAGIDGANKGSIQFHEKLGFNKVGHIPQAGFKFGHWLDLVFMQLILE